MTVDWSVAAEGWHDLRDTIEDTERDVTTSLLDRLAVTPGERVLELGAGTGEFAAALAAAVGPTGSVLVSDAAPGMVQVLNDRWLGSAVVSVERLDAERIGCADASFDAVVARMSLMFVPDPDRAFAEIRRVLRPGGRLVAAVWGPPCANPWLASVGLTAMAQGLVSGGPPVGPGEVFSLADPDAVRSMLDGAGFIDVAVERLDFVRHYRSAEEHLRMVRNLAAPLAAAFAAATPEQHDRLARGVADATAQFADGAGLTIPAQAIVLRASAAGRAPA